MRLQCPTCGARYQVADTAIPAAGRTVQCGSCNGTWFQTRPAPAADPVAAAPDPAPVMAAEPGRSPAAQPSPPTAAAPAARPQDVRPSPPQDAPRPPPDLSGRPVPGAGTDDLRDVPPFLRGAERADVAPPPPPEPEPSAGPGRDARWSARPDAVDATPETLGRPGQRSSFPREDWELEFDPVDEDEPPPLPPRPRPQRAASAPAAAAPGVSPQGQSRDQARSEAAEDSDAAPGADKPGATLREGPAAAPAAPAPPGPASAAPQADVAAAAVSAILERVTATPVDRKTAPPRPQPSLETPAPIMPPGPVRTSEPAPVPESRFSSGLMLPLLVFVLLLAVYALRVPLAGVLPQAAPLLDSYAALIDSLRLAVHASWVEGLDLARGLFAATATAPTA